MNNINEIIARYWEAETTLEEEQLLRDYFTSGDIAEEHKSIAPLFDTFHQLSTMTSRIDVAEVLRGAQESEASAETGRVVSLEQEAKVFSLKRYIPAVAAISVALMAVMVAINLPDKPVEDGNRVVVLDEEGDEEEALRVTREALALLSRNYKKGAVAVENVHHIDKVNIFHTN